MTMGEYKVEGRFEIVAPTRTMGESRRRLWVGVGLVALMGLVCVAYRADGGEPDAESSLATQALAEGSSGFKVIAGWKSQHHSYARESPPPLSSPSDQAPSTTRSRASGAAR